MAWSGICRSMPQALKCGEASLVFTGKEKEIKSYEGTAEIIWRH